jgi:hypothetical protein
MSSRVGNSVAYTVRAFLLLALLVLAACSSPRNVNYDDVDVVRAEADVRPEKLLYVGIVLFDPGIPDSLDDQEKKMVFPDVRRAEARYMPYHLKGTLEGSGHWGAVWVLPQRADTVDLIVMGKIDKSDGLNVSLKVGAWDSTGREWLNKRYKTQIPEKAYSTYRDANEDPYQNIYNEIANDLLEERQKLSDAKLTRIREVSELRYGAALVPDAFEGYLVMGRDGRYEAKRLPSADDPMVQRLRAVREREYTLVDTLNEYYAGLYYDLSRPYEDWRKASREDSIRYIELKRQARMRQVLGVAAIVGAIAYESAGGGNSAITNTAILGGIEGFKSGMGKSSEADLYQQSLRELGSSFDSEAEPLLIEVDGQTRRLTGTAEEKYDEWRRILEEIYAAETGLVMKADIDSDDDLVDDD